MSLRGTFLFLTAIFILSISACIVAYLFLTPSGGRFIIGRFLSYKFSGIVLDSCKAEGSLSRQLILKDCTLRALPGLAQDSFARIQKVDIYFDSFRPAGLNVEVYNARLFSSGLGPVILDGIYQDSKFDIDIYSPMLNISELRHLFPRITILRNAGGLIEGIDISASGSLEKLEVTGSFQLKSFFKDTFLLKEIPVVFDLRAKSLFSKPFLEGEIAASRGEFILPRSSLKIGSSKILFSGDPAAPVFDIKGSTVIEGFSVHAVLGGTPLEPHIKLTSDPRQDEDRLLLMLVTGQSWSGSESGLSQGGISAEMVKEFFDYFILGGSSGALFKTLGIDGVTLKFDDRSKGIGVKKDITDNVELSYAIEQPQESTALNQTQGESFNDALYLKYKSRF